MEDDPFMRTIAERAKADDGLFFVEPVIVSSDFGYNTVRRHGQYGLMAGGQFVLPAVFDELSVVSAELAMLKVNGRYACYSLAEGVYFSGFEYVSFECCGGFLKLFTAGRHYSLYELAQRRFISGSGLYDEFNLADSGTEFIWAKSGRYFDFIRRADCEVFRLPSVTMAYDTASGMVAQNEYGEVSVYNHNCAEDRFMLRKLVIEAGGYLALNNHTYHIRHIIDISGNIVNI